MSRHSAVTTEATQADGGDILITAPLMVRLQDSAITATVGGGPETVGGNITIDPQFIILQRQPDRWPMPSKGGVAISKPGGGRIAERTRPVSVSASSALGINGVVDIRAPVTDISGSIAPLPQAFAPAAELLRDRCTPQLREARASRFVVRGREGVPVGPDGVLLSPLGLSGPVEGVEGAASPGRGAVPRGGQEPGRLAQGVIEVPVDEECPKARGAQRRLGRGKRG